MIDDNAPSDPQSKPDSDPSEAQPQPESLTSKVSERVTRMAGVEKLEGFRTEEFFQEVFKKHSRTEVENYFTVGTQFTTPEITEVDTGWPKPWMFLRTFVGAVLVYILFVQGWREFGNLNLVPGLIMVGSFAVPISTVILFMEMNARRNVSLYQVIRLVFMGGILSIILALLLFEVSDSLKLNWLGASVAGLVEEPGKLLALVLVINDKNYRFTLNGLLFGAAVGAGFAAFESAGYALYAGLSSVDPDAMTDSIMVRGMLSPFAHIAWTGMCAAALWRVKGDRRFELSMVRDPRFLRVFAFAVVMHMIWNSPLHVPFYGKYLFLGIVAWIIILGLVQEGLKQLMEEKAAA